MWRGMRCCLTLERCLLPLHCAGPAFRKRERLVLCIVTLLTTCISPVAGPRFGLSMKDMRIVLGVGEPPPPLPLLSLRAEQQRHRVPKPPLPRRPLAVH
jgi:hypothetical protein